MKLQIKNKIVMLALEIGLVVAIVTDWLLIKPVELLLLILVNLKRRISDLNPVLRKKALKKMYSEKMNRIDSDVRCTI